jgi:hypothetical protein
VPESVIADPGSSNRSANSSLQIQRSHSVAGGRSAEPCSSREAAAKRIPEAIERLIELYTATNKLDEAAKWQAERPQ